VGGGHESKLTVDDYCATAEVSVGPELDRIPPRCSLRGAEEINESRESEEKIALGVLL